MAPAPRGSATGVTFPCSQCDKTFSRKEYMARHFRSKHSKEKPFSCEYCSHGFSRSDLLRRHYKTCSEAKALGVSGPPPGSEQTSTSRKKPKRQTSDKSVNSQPDSPEDDDEDETMFEENPEPVASTSNLNERTKSRSPSRSSSSQPVQQLQQQAPPPQPIHHSPYYSPPPHPYAVSHQSQPHPSYNMPPSSYGHYSHPQMYRPYPSQQYPNPQFPPPPNSSHPQQPSHYETSNYSGPGYSAQPSAAMAAESLTQYLRQHHQTMQHQIQPSPLPIAQPNPTQAREHTQQRNTSLDDYPSGSSSSSSSAFRPGTATTDTLAPGLSGTGSFSADEVLASEVLRDLMRSPMSAIRPGMSRGNSGDTENGNQSNSMGREKGKGRDSSKQKSGAVMLGNHQNEWGMMGGFDGFGSTRANTPIEESPAARALSEYFNKGGVGGISALDLGFPTEPSLFADWLVNPSVSPFQEDQDRRFELSEQSFHLAYLYPWHVPPIKTLSKYAKRAAETLLPSIPVFHAPSVVMSELALHGAFALSVAGAAYETEGQSFSNEMLVEKRVFLIKGFLDPTKNWDDRFATLQSLLLYQLLGLFHRDEQQRLLSHQFHTSLIYMLKQLDLPKKIRETSLTLPPPNSSPEMVDKAWKDWVQVETWKRVAFIVFLTDLEYSVATGSAQFVMLSDMDLDLPASEFVWSAENAFEWHTRSLSCSNHPPLSFLAAVRALMAPQPEPFSEHALILAELSLLSSFPLLILSRMLSYTEKKCEEALQQTDPFRHLLGGLGMTGSREQENRSLLVRIRNGREILRRLPGGMARGGGENWFQDVMPSPAGGKTRRESSSSTFRSSHSSTASNRTKTSSPATSCDSLNTPPQDTFQTFFSELEEEDAYGRDPNAYKPYHGDGGARPGETYEQAQERLRRLRESRMDVLQELGVPAPAVI